MTSLCWTWDMSRQPSDYRQYPDPLSQTPPPYYITHPQEKLGLPVMAELHGRGGYRLASAQLHPLLVTATVSSESQRGGRGGSVSARRGYTQFPYCRGTLTPTESPKARDILANLTVYSRMRTASPTST